MFDSFTLKTSTLATIANHVLLIERFNKLQKQYSESFETLGPLHPTMVGLDEQLFDDSEEINERGSLGDDVIKEIRKALDAGTDVLDILVALIAQYKNEDIAPMVANKPTKMEVIIKAMELGVTGDELTEMRVNTVMTEFESPRQHDLSEYLDEDGTVQVLDEPDGSWTGLTEDDIAELVRLEGDPLWELLSGMVADGLIVEHEGVYIPLPIDEFAE